VIFIDFSNHHPDVYTYRDTSKDGLFTRPGHFFDHVQYLDFDKKDPFDDRRQAKESLKGFELAGYKVVGAWDIKANHFDDRLTWRQDLSTLPSLLTHWRRYNVATPFAQWVVENPHLTNVGSASPGAYGLFYTEDGKTIYVTMRNHQLEAVLVENSLFIRNGRITTLVETMERQLKRAEAQVRDVQELHKQITQQPFDYVDRIRDAGLIDFLD